MLVLSRKPGERVIIGSGITVTVVEITGNRIRIGIDAPDDVRILRGELADWHEPIRVTSQRPEPKLEERAPRRTLVSRVRRPRALCVPR
jgi:carbon storage regulator